MASETVVQISTTQFAIISALVGALGAVLIFMAKRTIKKVDALQDLVTTIRIDLPTKYQTIERCDRICSAPRFKKVVGS